MSCKGYSREIGSTRDWLMMRNFEPIDDETPIDQYPEYIGLIWDGNFYPGPELEVLTSFELHENLERSDLEKRAS